MDGVSSDPGFASPPDPRNALAHFPHRLRYDANTALVFADSRAGMRNMVSLSQEPDFRHVQAVAELLVPFVANRAQSLATHLISTVGSLGAAMNADPEQIADHELSDACRLIQAARRLSQHALVENFSQSPVVADDPCLLDYLRALLNGTSEALCAIFLNADGGYIKDELLADGSVGRVRITPRVLFARAFELRASRLIVAHNHPSGDCRPSAEDRAATHALAQMGRSLEVELIDHLIISRRGFFSFRKGGLL